jgi:hypothetical protein
LRKSTGALILAIGLLLWVVACGNSKPFNSSAWLKSDLRERGRMTESLVKSKALIGKSADEVQQMLGKADTNYGQALSYNIDMGVPFRTKHEGLLVYVDGNRRVTEVKIVD